MKKLTFLILTLATTLTFHAQVAINTIGTIADNSAMLDVKSTDKGILIPRTDTTAVNNTGNLATGLTIFQSSDNKFYYYNGTKWEVIAAGTNPVFERNGSTIRQIAHYGDDFIIGHDSLPANGESVTDTLLFFDKSKGAFRAGILNSSNFWSPDNIGYGSFAFGFNTKAKGLYSAAWGYYAQATGAYSTAWGFATANGAYSTAWGHATATGQNATAWGNYSQADGESATAWGIGYATGYCSTAHGLYTNATGAYSTVWGYNTVAIGNFSTVWGFQTIARSAYETTLGQYNTDYTPASTTNWNANDRLFQIGNGTSPIALSNALTIYKNGNTIIGRDTMPANGVATTDKFIFFDKDKGSFRGGFLYSSVNWSPDSIGIASFAYGLNTKAKGEYSAAWGNNTTASGSTSTASGIDCSASGDYSNVWGYGSSASGYNTTAWGEGTFAKSAYETVLGQYNKSSTPFNTQYWDNRDALFVIGNGTSSSARSNALTIYKNGDFILSRDKLPTNGEVVSDTLLFYDESKGAFRAGILSSNSWSPNWIGNGSVAFGCNTRALGLYSAAWGKNSEASGDYSTAWGRNSEASGDYSTAWGYSTYAIAAYETTLGRYNTYYTPASTTQWDANDRLFQIGNGTYGARSNALTIYKNGDFILSRDKLPENGESVSDTLLFFDKSKAAFRAGVLYYSNNWSSDNIGVGSFAFGNSTKANGLYATAWGNCSSASGDYSTAWGGQYSDASGDYSTAWGYNTHATGDYSTAWGYATNATGDYSTAWGSYTHAKAGYETALGQYNNGLTPYSATTWDDRDVLFVIGNGSYTAKHNALTLWKDGRLGLGDAYEPTYALQLPNNSDIKKGQAKAYAWTTYSDSRIKFNQKPLQYGLAEIMKLQPKSYIQHSSNFENGILNINNNSGKETIGLIAQEVYKVIPEASNKPEDENSELWSMDYIRLIPVLIKGMQQQQQTIEKQNKKIDNLKQEVYKMKTIEQRLENLEKQIAKK